MEVSPGYKQTEVGLIPEDWDVRPIKSMLEKNSRITYGVVQPGKDDPNGVQFVRGGDVFDGKIDVANLRRIPQDISRSYARTVLYGGEILISLVGFPGESAIAPEELVGANIARQVALVRLSKVEGVNSRFICHYLRSNYGKRLLLKEAFGSAQQVINLKDVNKLQLPCPAEIEEQRAIATALSDMDALLDGLDRLIAKKRAIKQASMQQLLTGQTRLPRFSGEWEVRRLGDCVSIRNQKALPINVASETLCVELEHVGQGDGRLLIRGEARNSSAAKYRFQVGDILFGRLRSYLRKYWLATEDGICTTEIWPLMFDSDRINSGFLFALVQTDSFIEAASISYGTHMPRADWSVVRNHEIHLPSKEEQTAIATVLSDMDTEINALEARRTKTRALKQVMMQELLTGRTRLI